MSEEEAPPRNQHAPFGTQAKQFLSISAMSKTRGAHAASPSTCNPRPRASPTWDSTSEAPQAPAIPLSEGGVPSNPPHCRYETRRPSTIPGASTSCPKRLVRHPPAKKAKVSGLGESSAPPQPQPPAIESQIPFGMTPEAIIRRPMVTQPPIEGNLDCRAKPFHFKLCFDIETFRQQPELRDSFRLLQRYHLEYLMTLRDFFYPRIALDFYQSMTTRRVQNPNVIHFTIDGRYGILGAIHIAKALHIPYEPVSPADFREWPQFSQRDMVCILSRGTFTRSFLLRKELSPGIFLLDVMLRSNIFPLSIWCRGEELYWRLYLEFQRVFTLALII